MSKGMTLDKLASSVRLLVLSGLTVVGATFLFATTAEAGAPPITQLQFTTGEQTIDMGIPSAQMTVQTQNSEGISTQVSEITSLTLTSDSETGQFSDANCTNFISNPLPLTLSSGNANKNFCYRDITPGTHTITVVADGQEWAPAVQEVTVVSAPLVVIDGVGMFSTIQAAVDAATDGNVLVVYPGTYEETIDVTVDNIVISSFGTAEETIISGGGGSNQEAATIRFSANGVTLDGFTIKNNGSTRAIGAKSSTGTTITNNIITDSQRGISGDWYGRPNNLTITNNTFDGVTRGVTNTEGIGTLVITNNVFKNIGANAVSIGVGVTNLTLVDNSFSSVVGRHYANYDTELDVDVFGLLENNQFDQAYAVDDVASSIVQAIYSTLEKALEEAEENAVIVKYPENKVVVSDIEIMGKVVNILVPLESTPDSTPSVQFIDDTELVVSDVIEGLDIKVTIPAGTIITRTDGSNFSADDLKVDNASVEVLAGKSETAHGAIQFGLAGFGLTFSEPITISIPVGNELNGQTLEIYRSVSGTGEWTQDGIESPQSCVVTDGLCVFSATKASYYGAFDEPAPVSTGGGGYTPRSATTDEAEDAEGEELLEAPVGQVLGATTDYEVVRNLVLSEMEAILAAILAGVEAGDLTVAEAWALVQQIKELIEGLS